MDDPVVTDGGGTYERECIEEWLSTHTRDPETNAELESRRLVPNRALLRVISAWKQKHEKLCCSTPKINGIKTNERRHNHTDHHCSLRFIADYDAIFTLIITGEQRKSTETHRLSS